MQSCPDAVEQSGLVWRTWANIYSSGDYGDDWQVRVITDKRWLSERGE